MVWPPPDRAVLDAAYRKDRYADVVYASLPGLRRRRLGSIRRRFARASRSVSGNSRSFLDIGASRGDSLEVARQMGWEVRGIEFDPQTARAAAERLGIPVDAGPAAEVLPRLGSYDLINMSHVLEHVPDPARLFEQAAAHLSPDGALLLRVPNRHSIAAELGGRYWSWWCPPVHLWYLSERSIYALGHRFGLRIDSLYWDRGDAHLLPIELSMILGKRLRSGTTDRSAGSASAPGWTGALNILLQLLDTASPGALLPRLSGGDELVAVLVKHASASAEDGSWENRNHTRSA
jgi:SAM-dependent methyltransferase